MAKKKLAEEQESSRPIRQLNHNALPVDLKGLPLLQGVVNYLHDNKEYYHLNKDQLEKMGLQLEGKISEEKSSFRFETKKEFIETLTFVFVQTYFGLPVWEAGLSITVDKKRQRILGSISSAYDEIYVSALPNSNVSKRTNELYKNLGLDKEIKSKRTELIIQSERLLIYRFEADKRTIIPLPSKNEGKNNIPNEEFILPLPPVPDSIKEGNFYIVKEIIFHYPLPNAPALIWRAFIDLNTGAVLYLRAFGSNAMILLNDPITSGSGLTPSASDAALSAIRDTVILGNLNAPMSGVQSLTGSLVRVTDLDASASIMPPTETSPFNFSFNARTNNFAAVNTYFHCNHFLQLILDMGFGMAYFNGTSFPVSCDHRELNNTTINAHCFGNATGITSVRFGLADNSDTVNPLGIAVDNRIAHHEIGGHGILYCHVGSANFGFSHSAGDSFAVILNDPGSLAPDRFETFPFSFLSFSVASRRFHNRTPASGWGWSGTIGLNPFGPNDFGGYNNEQILSTTLFRLYRSIGGDSSDINYQRFASRFTAYLILKAISTLTSTTNPANALAFELAMENGDASDWNSLNPAETHAGGAYMKVIRWAFEKQGLFQIPGTATPNNNIGSPPPVDVYINDGRNGEYDFQPNHWSCQDIWNRTDLVSGDGGGVHQEPIVGQTNYAFVRIKNRGYQAATNITVKGFHCLPGVGLVYPNDWTAMVTAQLSAPDLAANDNIGEVIGPFDWVPSQIGHECMFFTVSANGDPCNIDSRVIGPIPEWRLVPHDNNIGQRNVAPVASGLHGLIASFENRPFWIRNTFDKEVHVTIDVKLPKALLKNKWKLNFVSEGGMNFYLKAGERKKVIMKLIMGNQFNIKREIANEQIEIIVKQDGIIVGGMNYYIDPLMEYPSNVTDKGEKACSTVASSLIKCLGLPNNKVKSVTIRKINIDICLDNDCT